ncbi:BtrU protein [Fictibacillus macauensis ZFHKF-1]|uniref:BtrU protein n=1 Tax=Fictibacillus macauensis ZFHKF-1 TaxID=1196324 RepID=I8AK69_9BACL|nr:suppressor of fused domain protein [Fictibacillus macauensis]EIT86237.1 BtrU protein [Fictibacillus macauensis ZFHKF-1]
MNTKRNEESTSVGRLKHHVEAFYKEHQPNHCEPAKAYYFNPGDPLEMMAAYESHEPMPHWHYVSYGLSKHNLTNEKESTIHFELTIRLKKVPGVTEPPNWVPAVFHSIAEYVLVLGRPLKHGTWISDIDATFDALDSNLVGLVCNEDPDLGRVQTEHGVTTFLQLTGITADEMEAMQAYDTLAVLDIAREMNLLQKGMTDLDRASFLQNEAFTSAVALGTERDGSSTGYLFVENMSFTLKKSFFGRMKYYLRIPVNQAAQLGRLFKGRLTKNRNLALDSGQRKLMFLPSQKEEGFEIDDRQLEGEVLMLSNETILELVAIFQPKAGTYKLITVQGMTVEIV